MIDFRIFKQLHEVAKRGLNYEPTSKRLVDSFLWDSKNSNILGYLDLMFEFKTRLSKRDLKIVLNNIKKLK